MFHNYEKGVFFDEMFKDESNGHFDHYAPLHERYAHISKNELQEKGRLVNDGFLEQGITFTVYGDDQGTERIFPFDLIPRIIPNSEWQTIEQGLTQRIIALNLFLHDIYHEAQIVKDGIIPESVVKEAAHY
jgi:uncharacterized circularly permuted ATP-grasp superfamily protein